MGAIIILCAIINASIAVETFFKKRSVYSLGELVVGLSLITVIGIPIFIPLAHEHGFSRLLWYFFMACGAYNLYAYITKQGED
ncbi:MAG: hypothetical protein IJJ75_06070 [Firmicutes bacterium]|nr:hypothetical protein [Bacillota bacterium]MBR0522740.1 hypothetical protein [Bacillota bacterium]